MSTQSPASPDSKARHRQSSAINVWMFVSVTLAFLAILLSLTQCSQEFYGASPSSSPTPIEGKPGAAGANGLEGLSAYNVWLAAGNTGTTAVFLRSLVGTLGANGYVGSDGVNGSDGSTGASAYQLWLNDGNTGTAANFFASLSGGAGTNGLTAYELWISVGNSGTAQDFLDSLVGTAGTNGSEGQSAYALWVINGHPDGTESDFLAFLVGAPGQNGPSGAQGDAGNTGSQGETGARGLQGETGGQGVQGEPGAPGSFMQAFGSFFDTTSQANNANPNLMLLNTTDPWSTGVSVNPREQSQINFEKPGVYNIQFSMQFAKKEVTTPLIDIWLRKNGVDVAMTNREIKSWGGDDRMVAAWNYLVEVDKPEDFFELVWQSEDASVSTYSAAETGRMPAIPSVIVTVTQVR